MLQAVSPPTCHVEKMSESVDEVLLACEEE